MIKSMTGFGKSVFESNNRKITVEIKSLNSKQSDISTRIPPLYREKELEIRKELSERLVRGKIDFSIFIDNLGDTGSVTINSDLVKSYFNDLKRVSEELALPVNENLLQVIMRLPDSVKINHETLNEEEWQRLSRHISEAISALDTFRIREGEALAADMKSNLDAIMEKLGEIKPFEEQRIESIKKRLTENLESLRINGSSDPNRFEQELIFYLERLDFNEEKIRLASHCRYFAETMEEPGSNGRKLSFITQEIGREINTIGSKANESNIQKIVVQMKDALERIKEQVQNIL